MKKAFTLIELMITITIIIVLTILVYAPYNYYQNKVKLKVASREISQALYEGRNMAMNGIVGDAGNSKIGVYFDTSESEKNSIKIFSYPYDLATGSINNHQDTVTSLVKTVKLQNGIQIDDIDGNDDLLFLFDAITGDLSFHEWDPTRRTYTLSDPSKATLNFSYMGSTTENLKKSIEYFTSTNIMDY